MKEIRGGKKMTDYTELIHRLRETESRSKRKLLDEAAATIEAM